MLSDLNALLNATTQNLSQAKAIASVYHLLLKGVPSINGFTFLINGNNNTNFGAGPGPVFNIENIFINIANALYQGNNEAKTTFDNLAAGLTLTDKLTSVYQALVDPSEQTTAGLNAFTGQAAFYSSRAVELGIPGDIGGAVVGFGALLNILVANNNRGIGNSVNDLLQAIGDGSAQLPDTSTVTIPIETADGTKFDGDDGGATKTITLTTNADAPGATAPAADTKGSDGNDTYNGIFDFGGTSTFTSADSIDGAGGTMDAVNLRIIDTSGGGSTITPQSTNAENFFLTNQDNSGFFALNFASTTGEMQVWSQQSVSGSDTRAFGVDGATAGMDSARGTFGVDFNGTRTGTTDAFSLALKGAGTTTEQAVFRTITSSNGTDDTFEIANISSSGMASNVKLGTGNMTLSTVNVSGDAALKLMENGNFAGLKMADASKMTGGGVDIDARGSSEAGFSFTGSSANDRIVLTNTTINTAGSLDGGIGKDKLGTTSFNNLTPSVVNGTKGFEVLEVVNPSSGVTASNFTTINEFEFSGGPNNGRVNIRGVENNDRFVFSSDQGQTDETVRFESAQVGNTLTFELHALSGTNGEVRIFANTNSGNDNAAIGFTGGFSKVTIDSTGQNSNANLIEAVDTGSNNYSAFDNDGGLSLFTITGSQDLTIGAKEGVNLSSSSDTFGFSNAANVNASAFTGVLRIAGSVFGDVLVGGTKNDIMYGLGGTDVLTGNDGMDQFRFVGATGPDRITDFTNGTDKIGSNEVNFGNTTATSAGAVLNTADYVDNRNGITDIGAADDDKVIELQSALSTAQIQNDTGATIEAYVLVFNSTTGRGELWHDNDWATTANRDHVATFDNVVNLTGVTGFSNTDFVEFTA